MKTRFFALIMNSIYYSLSSGVHTGHDKLTGLISDFSSSRPVANQGCITHYILLFTHSSKYDIDSCLFQVYYLVSECKEHLQEFERASPIPQSETLSINRPCLHSTRVSMKNTLECFTGDLALFSCRFNYISFILIYFQL